jgi:hypothetical protein
MGHMLMHAESSARKFGGKPEDYFELHTWFDASKELFGDFRHRALRHHSHGIFEAERKFGLILPNGVPTRIAGEQHVREDCANRIPDLADWLRQIQPQRWMNPGYPQE